MVYAMGSGNNDVVVRRTASRTPVKKPGGTVAKKPIPAPRQPSKALVPKGAGNAASKAYKAGRLIRVGGGPVLAATAAWEIAQAGKRNVENKKKQGYTLTGAENESGYGGMARPKFVKDVQAAAKRRTTTLDERREQRMKTGTFHGKYYGPEAFKGDIKMLKAYRSAGSPKDKEGFASDFKKKYGTGKGWQGTQNKGQGAGDQWRKEIRTVKDGKWSSTKPNVRLAKAKGSREPGR